MRVTGILRELALVRINHAWCGDGCRFFPFTCGDAALGGIMIRRRFLMIARLVVLSAVCVYVGYAFGDPLQRGPCNTDGTSTCAYTCIPDRSNDPPTSWTASTDQTQLPYCANTDETKCNPKGSTYPCWLMR